MMLLGALTFAALVLNDHRQPINQTMFFILGAVFVLVGAVTAHDGIIFLVLKRRSKKSGSAG
jgi:hypothetical protein